MNILHYTINRRVTTQKLRKATLSLTCLTGAVLRRNEILKIEKEDLPSEGREGNSRNKTGYMYMNTVATPPYLVAPASFTWSTG